jgi:hypothetical protein
MGDVSADGIGASNPRPVDAGQVVAARRFFRSLGLRPARTYCTTHAGSYELKHLAELYAGEYVSNGALIVAAFFAGIPQRRDGLTMNTELAVLVTSDARVGFELLRARRFAGPDDVEVGDDEDREVAS